MENIAKRLRIEFFGEEEEPVKEHRLPVQKVPSFKEKREKSWWRRQLSGLMSSFDSNEISEPETVMAAVAYAITTLEESESQVKRRFSERKDARFIPTKSKKDEGFTTPTGDVSGRKPEPQSDRKTLENITLQTDPTARKAPIFTEKDRKPTISGNQQQDTKLGKTDSSVPDPSVSLKPAVLMKPERKNTTGRVKPVSVKAGAKADAWEKARMEKIKKRYDMDVSVIKDWEKRKKEKAYDRLHENQQALIGFRELQRQLEAKSNKATGEYNRDMERIEKNAKEVRIYVEAKMLSEETKTKDKANKIRSTGRSRSACRCF
ncbi:remorin isoform X1 [Amborella trichopoda]|uniref:Remorin C-terminal domain-containing protein n=2 Tax=Amborella trichopoda TaxID=13333 RepID=W1NW92_AMBTC|nr:remorin isoform X1 [Amborella trichopoda]ERM99887.1 hypothetical protein AMTR_s00110p00036630 [Amborella trichopoda]|eukprot:XP_020519131.1 remorin isoform X1 [Amborella trichopoda]